MAIQREVGSKKKSKRYVIFRPLFFSTVSGLFYFLFVIGSLSKKKKMVWSWIQLFSREFGYGCVGFNVYT